MPPEVSSPEAAALPPLPSQSDESRTDTALGAGVSVPTNPAPSFFRSMLGDGAGNVSAMRVVFIGAMAVIVITWSIISIRVGALQVLPDGVGTLVAILTGGKIWQNSQENSSSE